MARFLNTPFPYLDKLRYRLLHVLIILVFSIVFIIVFEPFGISDWIRFPPWINKLGLASVGMGIAVAIACSQLVIRTFFPIPVFRISHFIFWVLSEILAVSLIETFIFADYSEPFIQEFLISLKFISIGLVLPYAFSILILILLHQKHILTGTKPGTPQEDVDLIHFRDEREQVKFSVRKSYILYLESSDNYVTIFYSPDGQIKKDMVRSSMKKMESQLTPHGLIRCHRSFMVNLENVQWIKKKGRNYQIKMKNCDLIIPVSRGYHSSVRSLVLE
jgi:hypothetical protein